MNIILVFPNTVSEDLIMTEINALNEELYEHIIVKIIETTPLTFNSYKETFSLDSLLLVQYILKHFELPNNLLFNFDIHQQSSLASLLSYLGEYKENLFLDIYVDDLKNENFFLNKELLDIQRIDANLINLKIKELSISNQTYLKENFHNIDEYSDKDTFFWQVKNDEIINDFSLDDYLSNQQKKTFIYRYFPDDQKYGVFGFSCNRFIPLSFQVSTPRQDYEMIRYKLLLAKKLSQHNCADCGYHQECIRSENFLSLHQKEKCPLKEHLSNINIEKL